MEKLQDVLEQIKKYGAYAVSLMFGADVGADDSDIKLEDREIKIWWCPVGVIGEARVMFKGDVESVLTLDIGEMKLEKVSNPPKDKEIKTAGLYIWGCKEIMKDVPDNLKLKNWMTHLDKILAETPTKKQ